MIVLTDGRRVYGPVGTYGHGWWWAVAGGPERWVSSTHRTRQEALQAIRGAVEGSLSA